MCRCIRVLNQLRRLIYRGFTFLRLHRAEDRKYYIFTQFIQLLY